MAATVLLVAGVLTIVAFGASATAVLLAGRVPDPWRTLRPPANGAYRTVSDGAEIFVRSWLPAGDPIGVILAAHGLGQHGGYHAQAAERFAGRGIAYHALDLRGNGFTRTRHGDVPSLARQYADLTELVDELTATHPRTPIHVLGHSLGAGIVASWAAETSPRVSGLILVAPLMTATAVRVPWINMLRAPAAYLLFRHRPVLAIDRAAYDARRLGPLIDVPGVAEQIEADPLHLRAMSMSLALAVKRVRDGTVALAPRIALPTLTIVGTLDPAAAGARAMHAAAGSPSKRLAEIAGGTHFLLQGTQLPQVVAEAAAWLDQPVAG